MAIVAAVYGVLTILIAPLSYGPIQFRLSEVLKVLVLYNPVVALGIGIGTFFANLASPFVGPWELIWMPVTDILGGFMAWFVYDRLFRRRYPAFAMALYALTTGFAVALMLSILGIDLFYFALLAVGFSEAVILIGGIILIEAIVDILRKRDIHLEEW